MGQLKVLVSGLLMIYAASLAFGQEEDSAEEEERIEIPEDVFVPSEQISEDNAVPFPVDI